jgi:heat shock protein HslJ
MKSPVLALLLTSALLSGCQTTTVAIQSADQKEYKAHGTEPFWGLKIEKDSMTFSSPDQNDVRVTNFEIRISSNGQQFISPKMTVDTIHGNCSDGMSDWTFRDEVIVRMGDLEFKGCGGGILAPESLEGTSWRIAQINGDTIVADREAVLAFGDGRVTGSVGCNRLSADYKFATGSVSFGPAISTKMACSDPVGKQEFTLVTVLGNLASTEFPGDGSMVLTGRDGDKIVLMQSI